MGQFFLKIFNIAFLSLLFCWAIHPSVAMQKGEEVKEEEGARCVLHFRVEAPSANFTYATFPEAFFDLRDKKFPELLINAEAAIKRFQRAKDADLEKFCKLFDMYLNKMSIPFHVFLTEELYPLVLFNTSPKKKLEEVISSLEPPSILTDSRPRTRVETERKEQVAEATSQFFLNPTPSVSQATPLGKFSIADIMHLSKSVCDTREGLLALKRGIVGKREKESLWIESIEGYKEYLHYFEPYETKINSPENRLIFVMYKTDALQKIRGFLEDLRNFYLSQGKRNEHIDSLKTCRSYSLLEIDMLKEYQRIAPATMSKDFETGIDVLLNSVFAMSISEYGFYFLSDPTAAYEAYRNAQNYNTQLREMNRQNSKQGIKWKVNNQYLADLKEERKPGEAGEKAFSRIQNIMAKFKGEQLEGKLYQESIALREDILKFLTAGDSSRKKRDRAIKQVVLFEHKILETEKKTFLSLPETQKFYKKYREVFDVDLVEFSQHAHALIYFFMVTAQFEHGLDHIRSFKEIYDGYDQKAVFEKMDIFSCIFKAMNGDPEAFLELEEIYRDIEDQKREEQERILAEKKKKHERWVQNIKDTVSAEAAQKQKTKMLVLGSSKRVESEMLKSPSESSPDLNISWGQDVSEGGDERAEKLKRHEESQKAREEEREEARKNEEHSLLRGASSGVQAEATAVREDIWFPFGESIKLTTAQKRIDLEIEQDSWNFKKADLERYYEEFGCKVSQNGRHTKAALPAYKDVRLPDGMPLSVMFEGMDAAYEGGAFTLPNWQDQVPFYLRKQILKARGKIQAYFDLLDRARLHQFE